MLLLSAVINLSFFCFFNLVGESLHWCINVIFKAFFLRLFLTHRVWQCPLSDVKICALSSIFLSFDLCVSVRSLSTLRMFQSILLDLLLGCLWVFCRGALFSKTFSFFSSYIFLIFTFISDCFIIFTNPSGRAGYDSRSIFKRSLTGLDSEFSFS